MFKTHLSIIILGLFTFAFGVGPCIFPYECLTSAQCALKLIGDATEEVIFLCSNRNTVCCPPNRANHTTHKKANDTTHIRPPIKPTIAPTKISVWIYSVPENSGGNPNNTKPEGTDLNLNKHTPQSKLSSHKNFRLLPRTCGITNLPNRITEGDEAELGEFPWMSLLGVKEKNGSVKWICGGTLISKRYVLTAAHCIYRESNYEPVVRLGEHDLEKARDCDNISNICLDPPQDLYPEEIIVHQYWNKTTLKNDIALIRLPRDVSASLSVSPICLPLDKKEVNVSDNTKFDVAGWGKTEWDAPQLSSFLRKATISGVSMDSCNICKGNERATYCPITDKQVCAQGWKSVDVCKGDSGGPLMIHQDKFYQIGITSFKTSDYCGADNIPNIFTRVESYLDWILDNIRD